MYITDKNVVLKVNGLSKSSICDLLRKSNMFHWYGKANIGWYEVYRLKPAVIRQIKIDKINKKYDLANKLEAILDTIQDDVKCIDMRNLHGETII